MAIRTLKAQSGFSDSNKYYLSGSSYPGSRTDEIEAPVGSQYQDATSGTMYLKVNAGSGTDKWVLLPDSDAIDLMEEYILGPGSCSSDTSGSAITWGSIAGITLSNSDKTIQKSGSNAFVCVLGSTRELPRRSYFEIKIDAISSSLIYVGIASSGVASNSFLGSGTYGIGIRIIGTTSNILQVVWNGTVYNTVTLLTDIVENDILMIAKDQYNNVWLGLNGNWLAPDGVAPTKPHMEVAPVFDGSTSNEYLVAFNTGMYAAASLYNIGDQVTLSTVTADLSYTPPSWCNLASDIVYQNLLSCKTNAGSWTPGDASIMGAVVKSAWNLTQTYDPQGIAADAFDLANMTGTLDAARLPSPLVLPRLAGLGTVPEGWDTDFYILEVGSRSFFSNDQAGSTLLINNAYFDGGRWRYIADKPATLLKLGADGIFYVWKAVSGTAGETLSWDTVFRAETDNRLNILSGYSEDKVTANGSTNPTITFNGKAHIITLDAATSTLTAAIPSYAVFCGAPIILRQDGTGGRAVAFAGTNKSLGTLTLNTTANKDTVCMWWTPDGGTTKYISMGGAEA